MEWNYITEIISLVVGGGVGAFVMQIYTAKVNKKKLEAEAAAAAIEAKQKQQDMKQDAFDTMYQELNKCMVDYSAIAEEYRKYRDIAREKEENFQAKVQTKCEELAVLKSKINYLKGLRCYNTLCPNRIRTNPDKKQREEIDN